MAVPKLAAEPRPPLPEAFVREVRAVFGERLHLTEAMRAQHGGSETHFPVLPPDAVVFARSTEEVVALVRLCSAHEVPVIPWGAGTSVEGHTAAVRGGVSLDLGGMDAVLEVNAEDFDCTVQPGVRREQLNTHLRDQGLFFPIDPGANATIGGMASTRASGTNAVRYGTMREAVLSLEVVTPDARVIRTARRARKSAAGYDLTHLFVGAEGTLGIITAVTLRLHPIPEAISAAVCAFDSLGGAVDTVVQCIQLGVPLARVELLDAPMIRAVNAHSGLDLPETTHLFFEFHGSHASVAEQAQLAAELASGNGGGAFAWSVRPEERSKLWKARHDALYAATGLRKGCVGWPTDVCVPISRLAECIAQTHADLDAAGVVAPILGHVGDGNFHVIFVLDPADPAEWEQAVELNRRLMERALAMDGTCTGEHGIGLGKQDWLVAELGEAVDLMRTLKRSLDPKDLFNPGKIFAP